MALDTSGTGMAYVHTIGNIAEYEVRLSNLRVLIASVDEADPMLRIRIRAWGVDAQDITTNFTAGMSLHSYGEGENIEVKEHVDGTSVQMQILPRLGYLLAYLHGDASLRKALDSTFKIIWRE